MGAVTTGGTGNHATALHHHLGGAAARAVSLFAVGSGYEIGIGMIGGLPRLRPLAGGLPPLVDIPLQPTGGSGRSHRMPYAQGHLT
jgi:hypothetical protein